MSSILYYAKAIPSLRLASLRGALGFGSFSIFWTSLTFYLEQPPFYSGSDVAGLLGLVVGIVFLNMGLQAMHVTNQTIVFSTHPEATNRLNTVYMVSYFVGGAFGTFVGGKAWESYRWNGVVGVGATFVILCLIVHLILGNSKKYNPKKD